MAGVGFIGCGHMGGTLLRRLLATGVLAPSEVVATSRSSAILATIAAEFPGLTIVAGNSAAARSRDLLFLGVGTMSALPVMLEIGAAASEGCHLVFMNGGLSIEAVERLYPGPVTKIMPTLLAQQGEGFTLVCHGGRVGLGAAAAVERLLGALGGILRIEEEQFDAASELTSCAPALIAAICDDFARRGAEEAGLSEAEARSLVTASLLGTARLLSSEGESYRDLIGRVATRGGASEAGVAVLDAGLPQLFAAVFKASAYRHAARRAATEAQLAEFLALQRG